MSQDGLYDWIADQDCDDQPEPEPEPEVLRRAIDVWLAAARKLREAWKGIGVK